MDDQAVSIAIATIELFKAKQARVIIVGGMASSSSWIRAMSYSTLFGRTRRTRKLRRGATLDTVIFSRMVLEELNSRLLVPVLVYVY